MNRVKHCPVIKLCGDAQTLLNYYGNPEVQLEMNHIGPLPLRVRMM